MQLLRVSKTLQASAMVYLPSFLQESAIGYANACLVVFLPL